MLTFASLNKRTSDALGYAVKPFFWLHHLVEAHMDVVPERNRSAHISQPSNKLSHHLPMILGNRPTILHSPPRSPALDRVDRRVPDLAPNNILEVEGTPVVHNPLSDLATGYGKNLGGC